MSVPVAVCQAERNVDKEEGERMERKRQTTDKEKDRVQVLRIVPLGYKRPFSVA